MIGRVRRRLGGGQVAPEAAPEADAAWRDVLDQEAQRPRPRGRIVPRAPREAGAVQAAAGRESLSSQGDHYAHAGDLQAARAAYTQEAEGSPLDPFPIMQLIRLARGHAERLQLQGALEARSRDPVQRARAWLSLYAPVPRHHGRYGETCLGTLISLGGLDALDLDALRLALTAPPAPPGPSALVAAAAAGRIGDLGALIALDRRVAVFAPDDLCAALVAALAGPHDAACAALLAHPRTEVASLAAADREGLLDRALSWPGAAFFEALAERGIGSPRALSAALASHDLERVAQVARRMDWAGPGLASALDLVLARPDHVAALSALLDAGMPLDAPPPGAAAAPLVAAVLADRPRAVRCLLRRGARREVWPPAPGALLWRPASPACALELAYPDAVASAAALLDEHLVPTPTEVAPLDHQAWARELRPETIDGCLEVLRALFRAPLSAAAARPLLEQVVECQGLLSTSPWRERTLTWVGTWRSAATRQRAFALLAAARPGDLSQAIGAALRLFAASKVDGAAADAWFDSRHGTLGMIFWAAGTGLFLSRRPAAGTWPLDHLIEVEATFGPFASDAARLQHFCLALAFIDAGLDPADFRRQLAAPPQTLAAFFGGRVPADALRRMRQRCGPAREAAPDPARPMGSRLPFWRRGGPARPAVPERPPAPRPPSAAFPFLEARDEKDVPAPLWAFLCRMEGHAGPPLVAQDAPDLCDQAETLATDPEVHASIASVGGARAFLQLLQVALGAETLAEVCAGVEISTKPLLRIQRRAHPDKAGGRLASSRLINGLVAALRREGLAAPLGRAYAATAARRLAFYAGAAAAGAVNGRGAPGG